jgi:cytochrome P450
LTVAGSDKTATLLTAATFFLLKNQSKLELLTKEIRVSFADDPEITMSSVSSLKYEGAAIEEALRYLPPVIATSARMTPDIAVGAAPWPAYHSPLNFRDPDDFVPERWPGRPRYADNKREVCQPFSVGPRNFIGRKQAYQISIPLPFVQSSHHDA